MDLYKGIFLVTRIPGTPGGSPEPPGTSRVVTGTPLTTRGTPLRPAGTPMGPPGDAPGIPGPPHGTTQSTISQQIENARSCRLLHPNPVVATHHPKSGPLWARPLWAPWAVVGRALVDLPGPLRARPFWASLGPCGLLMGWALMGPLGPCGLGPIGPSGPSWAGP